MSALVGRRQPTHSRLVVHAEGLCPAPILCGVCAHDLPNPGEVECCRAWLREWATPRKTLNTRRSSYGLKHDVERASQRQGVSYLANLPTNDPSASELFDRIYVSNGAFIAAAIAEGYRLTPTQPGSPNAFFNFTVRRRAGGRSR